MLEDIAANIEDKNFKDALAIINQHLSGIEGQKRISSANSLLLLELLRNKFNSERALEVFTIAIERTLLKDLQGSLGLQTVKVFRSIGATKKASENLLEKFKLAHDAKDQRPARTGILAKIIGK